MELKEFFKKDIFAAENGCEILEIEPGKARVRLQVGKRHLNAGGACQGGAIFTLCDLAFAAAVNSHGDFTVSLGSTIYYHKAGREGDTLTAEALEVINHPRAPYCEVKVRNQNGDLVASFTGQGYRKHQ